MDSSTTMSIFPQNDVERLIFKPFGYVELNIINGIASIIYKEPCPHCGYIYHKYMPAKSFVTESIKNLGSIQRILDVSCVKSKYSSLYY